MPLKQIFQHRSTREYVYFVVAILAFAVGARVFEFERYVILLFTGLAVGWLVLKVVTDRQERQLYDELAEISDDEYEQFLQDAEDEGLVQKPKK